MKFLHKPLLLLVAVFAFFAITPPAQARHYVGHYRGGYSYYRGHYGHYGYYGGPVLYGSPYYGGYYPYDYGYAYPAYGPSFSIGFGGRSYYGGHSYDRGRGYRR